MTQNTLITGRLIARGAVIVILLIVGWLLLREQTREAFEGRSAGSIQAPPEHDWKRIDNPRGDGWKTEALASEISQQLDRLRAVIAGEGGTGSLSSIAASSFACGDLRPGNLATAYEAPSLVVRRKNTGAGRPEVPPVHRGIAGLEKALEDFTGPWSGSRNVRASFKVYGIEERDGLVETTQYLAILSRSEAGLLEEHSTWTARWKKDGPAAALLTSLEVSALEQTRSRRQGPLFSDRTGAVLGANPSFRRQLQLGLNHWLNRSQDNRFFALLGTPGLALGDVNGDGLDDLYVCQEGGLPNLLFLRNPDGTATDSSAASGANWLESSRAALLVDLDNDGRQDLAVTVLGAVVLAAGDGTGRFELRSCLPTGNDTMSLSAADPDLDGDLDLYVCSHKARPRGSSTTMPTTRPRTSSFETTSPPAENGPSRTSPRNRASTSTTAVSASPQPGKTTTMMEIPTSTSPTTSGATISTATRAMARAGCASWTPPPAKGPRTAPRECPSAGAITTGTASWTSTSAICSPPPAPA